MIINDQTQVRALVSSVYWSVVNNYLEVGDACLLRVKIRKDVLDALKPSLTEVPHKTVASHIVWRLKVATVGSLQR